MEGHNKSFTYKSASDHQGIGGVIFDKDAKCYLKHYITCFEINQVLAIAAIIAYVIGYTGFGRKGSLNCN